MKRLVIFVMLLAVAAGTVTAQTLTTGTLEGMVTDEDGNDVEGAIITVMGPQGVQITETNKNGIFMVRGLGSGTYKVKCEAANFAPVVQSDVKVFINRKTQLPFTLTKGMTEEVTVVSQAPLVDMKSTGTGATVQIDDFAPYVPLGRNLTSIYNIAPGVSDGGDPVLGNTNPSISGASGLENAYFVDGVNITNSGYGAIGAYSIVYGSLGSGVTYSFLEEVQVKTGGFEAEWGQAGGGVVNSVVRTGTNSFGFDIGWWQTVGSLNGNWGVRQDSPNWANSQEFERQDIALSVQGPILKDKLFYFLAYNPVKTDQQFTLTSGDANVDYYLQDTNNDGNICDDGVDPDTGLPRPSCTLAYPEPGPMNMNPSAPETDDPFNFEVGESIINSGTAGLSAGVPQESTRTRTVDNYAGKVSWFATANHKFEVSAFGDPSDGDVGAQSPTTFMRVLADPIFNPSPAASASGLDWGGDQLTAKYQGVWSPNFFTEIQWANKQNTFEESGPGTSFRAVFDEANNNTFGGIGFFDILSDEVDQYSFKNTHVFGNVELKYGAAYEDITWSQPRNYSGPEYTALFPTLTNFLVENDTDGDGVSDEIVAGSGWGQTACADSTNVVNGDCYRDQESTTGASITLLSNGTYEVTRTEFAPQGEATSSTDLGAFAQVSWDIIPNFTLKLGARYMEQELTGSGQFDLPLGTLNDGTTVGLAPGDVTSLSSQSYKFDSEIAPRIGFSWDIRNNGKYKLYGNWAEYYNRIPSDLAVRAFSNEVGTTSEIFDDPGLASPNLNTSCNVDLDGDGIIQLAERGVAACHGAQTVQGLAGGGSIILDGTQQQGMGEFDAASGSFVAAEGSSDTFAALNGLQTLTTNEATKLPYNTETLLGFAWEINDYTSFEMRYITRELGRVLEDIQFASNEQTWNLFFGNSGGNPAQDDPFPGHGAGAFGAYVFGNVGGNVNTTIFPLPVRDYDALEFVFNRRFNNGWMAYANYRYAELEGNYEGSFRNDNGQSDPFLTSLFDFPLASSIDTEPLVDANGDGYPDNDFNEFVLSDTIQGQFEIGPLNTQRQHILNVFLSKTWDFGLNVGGRFSFRTGQPYGPLFAHPTYRNNGEIPGFNPTYWWEVPVDLDIATDATPFNSGCNLDADGMPILPGDDGFANWCADGVINNDATDLSFYQNTDPTISEVPGGSDSTSGDLIVSSDATDPSGTLLDGPRLFDYDVVKRNFFGDTPAVVTFDLHVSYDLTLRGGQSKVTFLADIFNLFDDNGGIRFDGDVENRPGSPNPDFLKANNFQQPRTIRLGAVFTF